MFNNRGEGEVWKSHATLVMRYARIPRTRGFLMSDYCSRVSRSIKNLKAIVRLQNLEIAMFVQFAKSRFEEMPSSRAVRA